MNDPLAQLRDIHLPDAVSVWPLPYGYWIVLLLVVLAVVVWFRRHRRFVIHRAATAELNRLAADFDRDQNAHQLAKSVHVLIRRTALSLKPRHEAASLTGQEWIDYLHACTAESGVTFSSEVQHVLTAAIYQSNASVDAQALIEQCRAWIQGLPALSSATRQAVVQS